MKPLTVRDLPASYRLEVIKAANEYADQYLILFAGNRYFARSFELVKMRFLRGFIDMLHHPQQYDVDRIIENAEKQGHI